MNTGLEFHPIANCFPLIDGTEFDELVADIAANGVREPILLYDGMVLDGRNRYRASAVAGVDCPIETYDGKDPVGLVVSLNLRRRHLSEGQRAWVAANISNLDRGDNQHSSIDEPSVSRTRAAEMLNVSPASVDRARVVRDHGVPELHKRYLIHVAGFNLGILMRALFGHGTPREAASAKNALLFVIQSDVALAIAIMAEIDGKAAMLVITVAPETH